MKPYIGILDKRFQYTPAVATDISKLFAEIIGDKAARIERERTQAAIRAVNAHAQRMNLS